MSYFCWSKLLVLCFLTELACASAVIDGSESWSAAARVCLRRVQATQGEVRPGAANLRSLWGYGEGVCYSLVQKQYTARAQKEPAECHATADI